MTEPDPILDEAPAPAAPAGTRHTVFLLHGILLNRWFLWPLARHLRARGHEVINLSYPSTKRNIEEHAAWLFEELDRVREAGRPWQIDFVTHSLGGLVVRRLLHAFDVPEARRFLQIVPPNQGSSVARSLRDGRLYPLLYGDRAGYQLGKTPDEMQDLVGPRPRQVEMAILVGAAPAPPLRANSACADGGDGTVAWTESELDREVPILTVPYSHTQILFKAETWRIVSRFLEEGRLETGDG